MRKAFGTNDVIQVITLTGNAAYFVGGCTAHSFLGIPTGGRSWNELSAPSGPLLEKIQKKCENLKVLVGDERSMFGRTTLGWLEQHARYAVNGRATAEDLWGGIPVVWEMMCSFLLCAALLFTLNTVTVHHLIMVA